LDLLFQSGDSDVFRTALVAGIFDLGASIGHGCAVPPEELPPPGSWSSPAAHCTDTSPVGGPPPWGAVCGRGRRNPDTAPQWQKIQCGQQADTRAGERAKAGSAPSGLSWTPKL